MAWIIGIDEAGYGPNLGPLLVSATVWRTPAGQSAADLYGLLREVVIPELPRHNAKERRVPLADSKALYSPQRGLGPLERGVLALARVVQVPTTDWRGLWAGLAPTAAETLDSDPWHAGFTCSLPLATEDADLSRLTQTFSAGLAAAGVSLVALRSRAVFPAEFNALVRTHGDKATALSLTSLALAAEMLDPLEEGPLEVVCDKHGGRNRYGPLLQRQFPDVLVECHGEGRAESTYRFGPSQRRVEFRFRAKGEELLPVAAASMISKYLRELSMRAFNEFWQARVPELAPTAGYPVDARRFKRNIAAAQAALGIEDCNLWRER